MQRAIRRIALLLGAPHLDNLALVDEVAAKGYQDIGCFIMPPGAGWFTDAADWETAVQIAARTRQHGLGLLIATCYSKNMKLYLQEHPEQRLVVRAGSRFRPDVRRGCPFHPDYKAQHVRFLRQVATLPALRTVWIDDEARLGFSPDDYGCYCASCRAQFREAEGADLPETVDWTDPVWRRFIGWRMARWTAVHNELADVLHEARPAVQVVFQTTPLMDLVGTNPWPTAIDLSAMADGLDGLSADPYYAASETLFRPRQTYLSHWTRFLRGHVPQHKPVTMAVGFSNPAAAYQPREEDGYWNGLIPLAAGADECCWLFYDLQRQSRTITTYEATFKLDPYFAQAHPLRYAAVVHSFQSEVWRYASGVPSGGGYDWTYVVPLAEILRCHGLPFGYLADGRLESPEMEGYRTMVLPAVACLSAAQQAALRVCIRAGSGTVVCGEFDLADERGLPVARPSLAAALFGIAAVRPLGQHLAGPVAPTAAPNAETDPTRLSPFAASPQGLFTIRIQAPDHPLFVSHDAGRDPEIRLDHCYAVETSGAGAAGIAAQVLATFVDADGRDTGLPAILVAERGGGRHVYFAGLPTTSYAVPDRAHAVHNPAPRVFADAVTWTAGGRPALALEGFPPRTAYQHARPDDVRAIPTVEFLPLAGPGLALACFCSYAYEDSAFRLLVDVPTGRTVGSVQELIGGAAVAYALARTNGREQVTVDVCLSPLDAAKVYCIAWRDGDRNDTAPLTEPVWKPPR